MVRGEIDIKELKVVNVIEVSQLRTIVPMLMRVKGLNQNENKWSFIFETIGDMISFIRLLQRFKVEDIEVVATNKTNPSVLISKVKYRDVEALYETVKWLRGIVKGGGFS